MFILLVRLKHIFQRQIALLNKYEFHPGGGMVHPKTPPRWFAKLTSRTLGGAEHLDGKEGSPTRHDPNHSLKRMRVLWRTPPCYACHCIGPPCGFWSTFLSFGGIHRLGLLVTAMWGRAWCEKLRLDWVFFSIFHSYDCATIDLCCYTNSERAIFHQFVRL